jgi:hypothetical protein
LHIPAETNRDIARSSSLTAVLKRSYDMKRTFGAALLTAAIAIAASAPVGSASAADAGKGIRADASAAAPTDVSAQRRYWRHRGYYGPRYYPRPRPYYGYYRPRPYYYRPYAYAPAPLGFGFGFGPRYW